MIGDIIMLTGIMPTCATVDSDEIGAAEASDDTCDTAGPATDTTLANGAVTADPTDDANPAACDATPVCGADSNPVKPARFSGGVANAGNAAATPVAPTW
jgi:hypothetical protein